MICFITMTENKYRVKRLLLITILLACCINGGCKYFSDVRITAISLINVPSNRLRFKVAITCNLSAKACLKYWKIGGKDTLYTDVTDENTTDTAYITNTEAETHYRFQAIAFNDRGRYVSKPHDFQTQLIYHATPYFVRDIMDSTFKQEMHHKYFLTQIMTDPGSLVIIDNNGAIVWYQPFDKGVKVSHWTDKGTILCIVGPEKILSSGGNEIYEVDLDGHVLRHLKVGDGNMDKLVHHEIRYDANGNLYTLEFTQRLFDLSSAHGKKKDTVHGDGIAVFNKSNRKIWEWSMLDHIDPLKDPNVLKRKKDWAHANGVCKDKDGNFLISFRDMSQIWKVEYPSGKVLWKIGGAENEFKIDTASNFSWQHAIHYNEYGQLMMLDNGVKRKQSRALAFKVDEKNKTLTNELNVPLPKAYFTSTKGNCSIFNHDKILFCLTDPKMILIADKNGKILWRISLAGDPYRVEEATGFLRSRPYIDGKIKF
jgi:arylsulfate sulfotransferase